MVKKLSETKTLKYPNSKKYFLVVNDVIKTKSDFAAFNKLFGSLSIKLETPSVLPIAIGTCGNDIFHKLF